MSTPRIARPALQPHSRPRRLAAAAALAAALAVGLPAGPVAAAECPAAGGVQAPRQTPEALATANPPYDLVINGGGFGHGVGMSQYGAQGAARLGCTAAQILGTYYPGTRLADAGPATLVRVGLTQGLTTARFTATGGNIPWREIPCDHPSSPPPGDPRCQPGAPIPVQPQGTERRVTSEPNGVFVLADRRAGATAYTEVWRGSDLYGVIEAQHEGIVGNLAEVNRDVKWGSTRFDSTTVNGGRIYAIEYLTPAADGSAAAMDRYLWGLAEVPVSWPQEALRTQAIAGRSYAQKRVELRSASKYDACRCDVYADTRDQFWRGWAQEFADAGSGGAWKQAVNATAGRILTFTNDAGATTIADTFYSSSHGGSSEAPLDIWGGGAPYLTAVDTSRWEAASDAATNKPGTYNGVTYAGTHSNWSVGYRQADLMAAFRQDFDTARSRGDCPGFTVASVERMEVVARGPGGHPTRQDFNKDGKPDGVAVTGRNGAGAGCTVWFPGETSSVYDPATRTSRSFTGIRTRLKLLSSAIEIDQALLPVARVSGANRIQTAVALSQRAWKSSETVIIARADNPADALAGSGLAGALKAPLLITTTTALEAEVAAEITRLGATRAILLGGKAALSEQVITALKAQGLAAVERVAGASRYDTAAAIADRLAPAAGGTALLVRGHYPQFPTREWADALAVSGLAARKAGAGAPWPILVVTDTVQEATSAALKRLGIAKVVIVGGAGTIPAGVQSELEALGYGVARVSGADRWATSRAVAALDGGTAQNLVAATGGDFPDGLAAGPFAARTNGRLLLVPPTYDAAGPPWRAGEHPTWIQSLGWKTPSLVVVGGEKAIATPVVGALRSALADGAARANAGTTPTAAATPLVFSTPPPSEDAAADAEPGDGDPSPGDEPVAQDEPTPSQESAPAGKPASPSEPAVDPSPATAPGPIPAETAADDGSP